MRGEEAPVVVRVLLVSDSAQVATASSVQTTSTGYADGWTDRCLLVANWPRENSLHVSDMFMYAPQLSDVLLTSPQSSR